MEELPSALSVIEVMSAILYVTKTVSAWRAADGWRNTQKFGRSHSMQQGV